MRRFLKVAFVVALPTGLILACGEDPAGPAPEPPDTIIILSVDPDSGLVDGADTAFEVTFQYELTTNVQASIDISFNNIFSARHLSPVSTITVDRGEGELTAQVAARAKDWGDEGDSLVGVIMHYSIEDSTHFAAGQVHVLTFAE